MNGFRLVGQKLIFHQIFHHMYVSYNVTDFYHQPLLYYYRSVIRPCQKDEHAHQFFLDLSDFFLDLIDFFLDLIELLLELE